MKTENFNLELKAATESMHRTVEATEISKAIMSPALTADLYADYLSKVYLIHSAVEKNVFPLLKNIISDTDSRIKAPFILDDLAHLHKKHVPDNFCLLDTEYTQDLNFNLGFMYVSEGSVLGGQYILKNIHKVLGPDAPGRFLNVYGETTGTTWKNFIAMLNEHALNLNDKEKQEIINGAVYGFKRVYSVFNQNTLHHL